MRARASTPGRRGVDADGEGAGEGDGGVGGVANCAPWFRLFAMSNVVRSDGCTAVRGSQVRPYRRTVKGPGKGAEGPG
ncbi:hypothetical protein GCM10010252_55300 [Streptomyces aureoverticillatus]|nr:hypothetical protein GCM10010252_55300 [Streptomyces aureoverticillatus]